MSLAPPPHEPVPFAPRIMLDLRDDPIPAGYGGSAHTMDKHADDDDDGELSADDNMDMQEEDKYVFLLAVPHF